MTVAFGLPDDFLSGSNGLDWLGCWSVTGRYALAALDDNPMGQKYPKAVSVVHNPQEGGTAARRFLARVEGPVSGNVLLRRSQYRASDNAQATGALAGNLVVGKLLNQRTVVRRALRDHGGSTPAEGRARLEAVSHQTNRVAPGSDARATSCASTERSMRPLRAGQYLSPFNRRRELLAEREAKYEGLSKLEGAVRSARRVIIFTQTVRAAELATAELVDLGIDAQALHSALDMVERREVLARFARGHLHTIVAPQVLDEGVDVPDADLGIIVAASRWRQMIQRMGRVLRPKNDGRLARFAVLYVQGTSEDPALGAHGTFLEEIVDAADSVRDFPVWGPLGRDLRLSQPHAFGTHRGIGNSCDDYVPWSRVRERVDLVAAMGGRMAPARG